MTAPCPTALRGIIPSLNTPFQNSGQLDMASLRRLVEHTITSGCVGMLVLAVAGEREALSPAEKFRFLEVAADHNRNRLPLIVSVTSATLDDSLVLAKQARDTGAAGICFQPPAGLRGEPLVETVARVADAGPDLLMIQDLDWTGNGLPLAEITLLLRQIPQFKCLKIETVPAGPKYSDVLAATGGQLHVSGGWAVNQMLDALRRGVHAFVPTGLEAAYVAVYQYYRSGDHDRARDLFNRLRPILAFSNRHIDISIRYFKCARKAEGLFSSDHCRPPIAALDPAQQTECEQAIALYLELTAERANL